MSQGWRAPDTVLVPLQQKEQTSACCLAAYQRACLLLALHAYAHRVPPSRYLLLPAKRQQALSAQRLWLYILMGEAVHAIHA